MQAQQYIVIRMKYCGEGNFAETDLICFQVPNVKYQRLLHHSVPKCPCSRWWRGPYFFAKCHNLWHFKSFASFFFWKRGQNADIIFVQNFTLPDFEAKDFTPEKCVICDIFSRKLTS